MRADADGISRGGYDISNRPDLLTFFYHARDPLTALARGNELRNSPFAGLGKLNEIFPDISGSDMALWTENHQHFLEQSFIKCQKEKTEVTPPYGGPSSRTECHSGRDGAVRVTISPGASVPSNDKPPFDPISVGGNSITWVNMDYTLYTATSGSPTGSDSGAVFDTSYIPAGHSVTCTFSLSADDLTHSYYCTLHPFMVGYFNGGRPNPP